MKLSYLFLILFSATSLLAQDIDTLQLLQSATWEFGRNRFGDDLVTLVKASDCTDTSNLSASQKSRLAFSCLYRSYLNFNSTWAMYQKMIDCDHREDYYYLHKYYFKNNRFTIYHRLVPWELLGQYLSWDLSDGESIKDNIPFDSTTYTIQKITPTLIVFVTEDYKGPDPSTIQDYNARDRLLYNKKNTPNICLYAPIQETKHSLKKEQQLQQKRKNCVFSDTIQGHIEVFHICKIKSKAESLWDYEEYQLQVTFRPNNYFDLPQIEQKFWDGPFLYKFAPTSLNLNPSKNYIRHNKLIRSFGHPAIALKTKEGVCNDVIFYSTELPSPENMKLGK